MKTKKKKWNVKDDEKYEKRKSLKDNLLIFDEVMMMILHTFEEGGSFRQVEKFFYERVRYSQIN